MKSRRRLFLGRSALILSLIAVMGCGNRPEEAPGQKEAITVSGSASAIPTVQALAAAYEKEHPGEEIHFLPGVHSGGGVMGTLDGTFDIGVASRDLTSSEEEYGLSRYPFATDLLVFAVHPDVKVRSLSTEELLNIYSGKITNWKDLGGADREIVVLDRPAYTSAKQALQRDLLGGDFAVTKQAVVLERPAQMDESLQSIPGSIGYTCYSNLFIRNFDIPMIRLNGMISNPDNFQRGMNRCSRTYTFLIKGRPHGLARRFIDFVYSAAGQEVIRSKGLLPEHRKMVVALAPAVNIVEQETRYRPLIQYLSRKCGIPIEVEYAASYPEIVSDFSNRKYDAAFLGSFAYALVNARTPLEVLGRPEENGQSYYTGILFVRQDSGIRRFEDLRGKTFCFVDKATTAGYLFPLIYLKEHGISAPENFFGKILFSGSHDASILSVLNGEADAGVAKDLVLTRAWEKNAGAARDLVRVATSLPVPTNGLCVRKSADWDLKEDLKEALLGMDRDPAGRKVLKRFGADRFLATSHKDYHNLYMILKELEIDPVQFLSEIKESPEKKGP